MMKDYKSSSNNENNESYILKDDFNVDNNSTKSKTIDDVKFWHNNTILDTYSEMITSTKINGARVTTGENNHLIIDSEGIPLKHGDIPLKHGVPREHIDEVLDIFHRVTNINGNVVSAIHTPVTSVPNNENKVLKNVDSITHLPFDLVGKVSDFNLAGNDTPPKSEPISSDANQFSFTDEGINSLQEMINKLPDGNPYKQTWVEMLSQISELQSKTVDSLNPKDVGDMTIDEIAEKISNDKIFWENFEKDLAEEENAIT